MKTKFIKEGYDKMYTVKNFKTKKALKEAVASGEEVTLFAPGLGTPKENGTEHVEGPHYPAAHSWYAEVEVKNGKVIKVK
jgi:hypothetical protein